MIACCDSWNAMRTDRVYRKALRLEVALDELTLGAGTQFDPDLVVALLKIIERTEGRPALAVEAPRAQPRPQAAPVVRPAST